MTLPVSAADARYQLRLDLGDASQDVAISGYIRDAAAWVEKYTGHILEARDATEEFSGFGDPRLRAWPISAGAAVAVTYGDALVLTGARLDLSRRPARFLPALGAHWPSAARDTPVSVTVRAGYEDPADVPGNLRRAMLLLIGAYDADAEGGQIFQLAEASARTLCRDFKARSL